MGLEILTQTESEKLKPSYLLEKNIIDRVQQATEINYGINRLSDNVAKKFEDIDFSNAKLSSNQAGYKLFYNDNIIIISQNINGTIIHHYSYDCLNWNLLEVNNESFYCICYGNNIYVASTESKKFMYSYDAINWNYCNIAETDLPTTYTNNIVFHNNTFSAFDYSHSSSSGIWYSFDGINWVKSIYNPRFNYMMFSTIHNDFVAYSTTASTAVYKSRTGYSDFIRVATNSLHICSNNIICIGDDVRGSYTGVDDYKFEYSYNLYDWYKIDLSNIIGDSTVYRVDNTYYIKEYGVFISRLYYNNNYLLIYSYNGLQWNIFTNSKLFRNTIPDSCKGIFKNKLLLLSSSNLYTVDLVDTDGIVTTPTAVVNYFSEKEEKLIHKSTKEQIESPKIFNSTNESLINLENESEINPNAGSYFYKEISANTSFTILNQPVNTGNTINLILKNAGKFVVTFPNNVKWNNQELPEFTENGSDLISLITFDGGSNWFANVTIKDFQ